jgi:hypothetical protein
MSTRTEYIDESNENITYNENTTTYQSHCSFCYETKCPNDIGLIAPKYNAWLCSGACLAMYQHDNKLVNFAPETVQVLSDMRKKYYTKEILDKRRKRY